MTIIHQIPDKIYNGLDKDELGLLKAVLDKYAGYEEMTISQAINRAIGWQFVGGHKEVADKLVALGKKVDSL